MIGIILFVSMILWATCSTILKIVELTDSEQHFANNYPISFLFVVTCSKILLVVPICIICKYIKDIAFILGEKM